MKNKATDLHNILFAQLEKLSDEEMTPEEMKKEVERAAAMSNLANSMVNLVKVQIQAHNKLDTANPNIPMIESK
jgi:hypothetical protein